MCVAIQFQRAGYLDQYVVGGAERQSAAPNEGGAGCRHDFAYAAGAQRHRGEYLHHVRRAGGRGNRAGGRLRNHQAGRGGNGDHDRGCPVAGQAAYAVLVGDDRPVPTQRLAGFHHGPGQIDRLAQIHLAVDAGSEERGDMHVGVAASRNVMHDRAELGTIQVVAIGLCPHPAQRIQRRPMRHANDVAFSRLQDVAGARR
ncbi:hypothetical protein D3C87_1266020 [compost metagenome]